GELRWGKAACGPVRGAVALRNPEAKKESGKIAQAGLPQAMALHGRSGIEHRCFLERKDELQLAQIVRERHTDLDRLPGGKKLGERRGEIHALQREKMDDARSGHLHQARKVVLTLAECRPRLG